MELCKSNTKNWYENNIKSIEDVEARKKERIKITIKL